MDDVADAVDEARYADEDTRPTSQKELWGWYSYGWAAEVFAICAMGKNNGHSIRDILILFPQAPSSPSPSSNWPEIRASC
jgi:hypothetical protein